MPPLKKIVWWLVVIFVLYSILTSPDSASAMVGNVWDILANGVQNIGRFFDNLLRNR